MQGLPRYGEEMVGGLVLALLSGLSVARLSGDEPKKSPPIEYLVARTHELKPHRRSIPVLGGQGGFSQLHLTLTVSATGDVTGAEAQGDDAAMKLWPSVQEPVGAGVQGDLHR